jgi:hypothetical protein
MFQNIRRFKITVLAAACALLTLQGACATKGPVLYPNDYYNRVGPETAAQDIARCLQLADAAGIKHSPGTDVAKETAVSAGIGAATGAAWEAAKDDAGGTAGASAAAAGTAGLLRGLLHSKDPNPVYKNFVEQCLRERGYSPIGWQ